MNIAGSLGREESPHSDWIHDSFVCGSLLFNKRFVSTSRIDYCTQMWKPCPSFFPTGPSHFQILFQPRSRLLPPQLLQSKVANPNGCKSSLWSAKEVDCTISNISKIYLDILKRMIEIHRYEDMIQHWAAWWLRVLLGEAAKQRGSSLQEPQQMATETCSFSSSSYDWIWHLWLPDDI